MASRLDLQYKLEDLLQSRNVYYKPPASITMNYPAIIYSRKEMKDKHADNGIYKTDNCYQIIVVSKRPDDPVIGKLRELPMCSWKRSYMAENLNHDVLELYY